MRSTRLRAGGFTVLELLVAVSIMSVIVFALYGMFNQTQKALRSNMAQVDVLESGRLAMELLSREMGEAGPVHSMAFANMMAFQNAQDSQPLVQQLATASSTRTSGIL